MLQVFGVTRALFTPLFRVAAVAAALLGATTLTVRAAPPAASSYHLIRKITLAGADGWDYLSLDARARRLYIPRATHVTVLNVDSGQVVGELPGTAGVHGVAVDAKSQRGFTSNGKSNSVSIFDLKTFRKIAETPVGEGPDAILYEPSSRRVFTFNGRGQSITALDAASGRVVGSVTLPGRPEFAVADERGELYDNLEDKSEIVAINARSLKIDHIWPLAPGEEPSGLAIDAARHRVFAVCGNQKMIVLDTQSGKVVASPTIGNGPDACAFDARTHLIFSPNGQDGTMTILHQDDKNLYRVVQLLSTQIGARTMALDPKTQRVFTIAAQYAPMPPATSTETSSAASRRRRPYLDGTVTLLIYGP